MEVLVSYPLRKPRRNQARQLGSSIQGRNLIDFIDLIDSVITEVILDSGGGNAYNFSMPRGGAVW